MPKARRAGSQIVSHCGLKLWELQAIQIIGLLKIGSGVRDCQRWDRERCAPKGSVQPTRLQACSPVLSGSCPTPRPAQVILGLNQCAITRRVGKGACAVPTVLRRACNRWARCALPTLRRYTCLPHPEERARARLEGWRSLVGWAKALSPCPPSFAAHAIGGHAALCPP